MALKGIGCIHNLSVMKLIGRNKLILQGMCGLYMQLTIEQLRVVTFRGYVMRLRKTSLHAMRFRCIRTYGYLKCDSVVVVFVTITA